MKREEHLKFCKVCQHQKFDKNIGLVCGLTGEYAQFENTCDQFEESAVLKAKEASKPQYREVDIEVVGMGTRFINYLLDLFFLIIFNFILGIILGVILAIVAPEKLELLSEGNALLEYAFGFATGMFYFTILESSTGKTFAKMITKTRVVTEYMQTPNFSTLFVRSLCRFIPFEPFSFLATDGIGWHDTLSKTRVIKDKGQKL